MKTVYLVKSSETLESGEIYWENLRVFESRDSAEKHRDKVQRLIDEDEVEDEVIIEEFTLEN
jgi:hypothetical protein